MKIRRVIKLAALGSKRITRRDWEPDESLRVWFATSLAFEWTDGEVTENWVPCALDIMADDWEVVE